MDEDDLYRRRMQSMKQTVRLLKKNVQATLAHKPGDDAQPIDKRIWHTEMRRLNAELNEQNLRIRNARAQYWERDRLLREQMRVDEEARVRAYQLEHRKTLQTLDRLKQKKAMLDAYGELVIEFDEADYAAAAAEEAERQARDAAEKDFWEALKRETDELLEDEKRRQKRQKTSLKF